jgi:glutathione S-transferase
MKQLAPGEQMSLYWSSRSPYVRYVTVTAHECGLFDQLVLKQVAVSPMRFHEEVSRYNPLGKIPVLVRIDGSSLIDSKMICRFLDQSSTAQSSLVPAGDAYWDMTRLEAIGIGLADLGVSFVIDEFRAQGGELPASALATQDRVAVVLDALEALSPSLEGERPHLGILAVAVALKYLDFRTGAAGDWRRTRPSLSRWLEDMEKRESFRATEFVNVF